MKPDLFSAGENRPSGRRRLLTLLRSRLGEPPLPLRLGFWDGETFDFGPDPKITITLNDRRLLRQMLTGNISRLADAYVDGRLAVEGRVEDILGVGMELADRIGRSPWVQRIGAVVSKVPRPHSRAKDAADIATHYDVSNAFYRLWLDERMVYSCAYFRTGAETIDQAQEQKLDHICRKLRLQPGERLLDIGCGWGALPIHAAKHYGARVVGITNSASQRALAVERVAAAGLSDNVEIRLTDYREIEGEAVFDKISSVGMIEHVGLANYPVYFGAIARLLKPGGALLNHGITVTDPGGKAQGPAGGDFIDRYVFPGGELPHISKVLTEIATCGLEPVDMEDLRPHYARTLQHWTRRLEAHRDAAIAEAGPERYRIWRVYMPGMAVAFDRGWLSVGQVLAYKPQADGRMTPRPWSRDYQYDGSGPEAIASGLDWSEF